MITLLCMYDLLNKPKGMKLNINLGLNTFLVTVANISSLVCVSIISLLLHLTVTFNL